MNLEQRINAFAKLGDFLSQFSNNGHSPTKRIILNIMICFLMGLNIK